MKFQIEASLAKQSGIYIIRNSVNHKVYVGSAKALNKRFYNHVSQLKRGIHHSPQLQAFVNKYGIEKLRFELLITCQASELISFEQAFLDAFKSYSSKAGFNTCTVAGSTTGVTKVVTAITRAKVSESLKGKALGVEHKANIQKSAVGRKHTAATKEKLVALSTGRKPSAQTRAKISASAKGKTLSTETKAKISAQLNKPETKLKRSAAMKGRIVSAETRAKLSEAAKRRKLTPETKAKLSTIAKLRKPK